VSALKEMLVASMGTCWCKRRALDEGLCATHFREAHPVEFGNGNTIVWPLPKQLLLQVRIGDVLGNGHVVVNKTKHAVIYERCSST